MKCYKCGCTLTGNDFCTNCGADVHIYKKIIYLSNMYYNDGLKRAQVRDLSGAVSSLRQSLKCNKNNIEARNLLGLVYFEMGEAVAAISEWVISKNLKANKNIADDFIQEVQSNPAKLDTINQTIKKYNQALLYCRQGSYDLAVIQLKKVLSLNPNLIVGYQLLALNYLNNEEWEKAKRTLEKAIRVDANNTTTLSYLREAELSIRARDAAENGGKTRHERKSDEAIKYQSGNETIIQPLNGPEKSGSATIINIIIGMVIGLAVMWFLVLPAKVKAEQNEINKQLVDVSTELTSKSADIDELNKRIEALQNENDQAQTQLDGYTGDAGIMQKYDLLCEAALSYMTNPDDILGTADTLEKIIASDASVSADSLSGNAVSGNSLSGNSAYSAAFGSLYDYLNADVSSKASEQYYSTGVKAFNSGDYASAITNLQMAYDMNKTDDDALFYLAQSYRKSDDLIKADELYNKLIKDFPDSKHKSQSEKYLKNGGADTADENTAADSAAAGTAADTAAQAVTADPNAVVQAGTVTTDNAAVPAQ